MTVEPGCFASSRVATSAVIALGLTASPFSSIRKTRSASPSKASPASTRPRVTTLRCRSTRLSGSSGFASWLGNEPSSSKYSGSISSGSGSITAGTV